ncbi:MAG: hypothetical protein RLW87_20725 [Alphaproteobacteria bacterium]
MARGKLDLSEDLQAAKAAALEEVSKPVAVQAAGKPSASRAKREGERAQFEQRTQMNFSNIPVVTKDAFVKEAKRRGYSFPAQLFYEMCREKGIPAPDPENLRG